MALQATMYRFQIALSDVDRGVYDTLDLRVARHPSETVRFLLARLFAFCAYSEAGLSFGRGLSSTDEPALATRNPDGTLKTWIDVGTPSAERLHKARKAAECVRVVTQHDPKLLLAETSRKKIHRVETIEVLALDVVALTELEEKVDRNVRWDVTITGDNIYVADGAQSFSIVIACTRFFLGGDGPGETL